MKITGVSATPVAVPFADSLTPSTIRSSLRVIESVVVQVSTDEGLVGLGEAPPLLGVEITQAIIEMASAGCLGASPFHVNHLMKTLYARHNVTHVHPTATTWAFSAIETALWDLVGKACGRPLFEIWGGPFRREVPYYGYVERQAMAGMEEEARRLAAAGFDTLYTKVGLGHTEDVQAVAAIRKGAPDPRVRIRVDANQAWSPAEAISIIKEMEPYGLEFVDQPVIMFNLDSMIRVKDAVAVPIAAHEAGWTMYDVLNVLKRQAADVIHVDPLFDLGLTGARISAGMAEAAGIPVVLHAYGCLGVGFAAGLQLIAATPNFTLANQEVRYRMITDDIILGGPLPFTNNRVSVPTGPGLGVTLDADRLRRYNDLYQREVRGRREFRPLAYTAMYLRSYLTP